MKIEVLYPSVANLYGDLFNIKFLEKCIPNCTIYYTNLNDVPHFVNEKIDLIYMGSMTEKSQEIIISKLLPYKEKIKDLIDKNTVFLITGNAFEIFGKNIDNIKGLGIFDYYSKRDFTKHHNSCFIGEFENIKIVGFKSCFSYTYNNKNNFIRVIKGYGFADNNNFEGIKYKNFFGTYLIGPILIYNPYFTKYILKLLNQDENIIFEDDIIKAYEIRKNEFLNNKLHFNK